MVLGFRETQKSISGHHVVGRPGLLSIRHIRTATVVQR